MITVEYVDTVDTLKGFTIYNGDFNIFINSHLNATEKTEAYLKEIKNIENGKYNDKLKQYNRELIV
jgi:hypothetical protein